MLLRLHERVTLVPSEMRLFKSVSALFRLLNPPVSSCLTPPQTAHPTSQTGDPGPPSPLCGPGSSESSWSDWHPATHVQQLSCHLTTHCDNKITNLQRFGKLASEYRTLWCNAWDGCYLCSSDCPHLGVPEAARPLCVNIILQDAFTDVVYCLSQPSFPAGNTLKCFKTM